MTNPFVHSNYPRIEDDNYQTIDPRCVYALLQHFRPRGLCVDVCAPNGSGIVDALKECGYEAEGLNNAFALHVHGSWIITNPPYRRGLVDDIVKRQIDRVRCNQIFGFAALLRSYFDHAKGRAKMFDHPCYFGQIRLRFRPWWSNERKAQPIHNFVWHIWMTRDGRIPGPFVWYADGRKPT